MQQLKPEDYPTYQITDDGVIEETLPSPEADQYDEIEVKPQKEDKELQKRQREEYKKFWVLKNNDPQKTILREQWYQKYHNMSSEEYREKRTQAMMDEYNPIGRIKRAFEGLSLPGLAWSDFGMDVVGSIPGLARLDNEWDRRTKIGSPAYQKIRKMLSVVLPSLYSGKFVAGKLKASQMPRWKKALVGAGLFSTADAAIIGLSDEGEEHNALRAIADFMPGVFGPKGAVRISDWAKTLDSDSSSIR